MNHDRQFTTVKLVAIEKMHENEMKKMSAD